MTLRPITRPNVSTDPDYWEKVLESHGLGLTQLGLQDTVLNDEYENENENEETDKEECEEEL